jgi:2-phosphoglycerate kinase
MAASNLATLSSNATLSNGVRTPTIFQAECRRFEMRGCLVGNLQGIVSDFDIIIYMAKAFFIGGAPRTGKTTLALKFISEKPILAGSTDAIRYTLRRVVSQADQPDLFHVGKFTSNDPKRREYLLSHIDELVDTQNKESAIVWKSVNNFVKSNLEDGFDILIEGIAILPEFLDQIDYDYSAVFLGNQSDEHVETMIESAENNTNDWMHELEEETIRAFGVFNQSFSRFISGEASKYQMPYIEVHDSDFDEEIKNALNFLTS